MKQQLRQAYRENLKRVATEPILRTGYVAHVPGHKDSKGKAAPWVIKDHDGGKILSSHTNEFDAKTHLRDMKIHGTLDSFRITIAQVEWALASMPKHSKRDLVQAAGRKDANFFKEIPQEVIKFIDTDIERAQKFFADKAQKHPEIAAYIQKKLNEQKTKQPSMQQDIAPQANKYKQEAVEKMKSYQAGVKQDTIRNLHQMLDLEKLIKGNEESDWLQVRKLVSPLLLDFVRNNTTFTAQEFFKAMWMNGGNLKAVITPEKIT